MEHALNRPTWKMDRPITVDSATLMNTGLRLLKRSVSSICLSDHVGVLIHPQSTIHSIVKVVDGSLRAHLSVTDMRLPILYALTYRDCIEPELRFPVLANNKTTKH